MSALHTAGPWEANPPDHHHDAASSIEIDAIDPQAFRGKWHGFVTVYGRVPPHAVQGSVVDAMLNELQANARLIAASPALLDACEAAGAALRTAELACINAEDDLARHDEGDSSRACRAALEEARRVVVMLDAIIAKVNGGAT